MGYGAEKEKVEKKARKLKVLLFCLVAVGVLIAVFVAQAFSMETWKYNFKLPKIGKRATGELRIHLLDEEECGATVIELPDGKILLIDGGKEGGESEKSLLRYLNALGVNRIDCLVVTSAEENRCGGLDKVLKYKEVERVYLPEIAPVSGSAYAKFYATLIKEKCEREYFSRDTHLLPEREEYGYSFTCLYPCQADEDGADGNENTEREDSAFYLTYAGMNFLFSALDSETETLLARDDGLGLFQNRGVKLQHTDFIKPLSKTYQPSKGFLGYLGAQQLVWQESGHKIVSVDADGKATLTALA